MAPVLLAALLLAAPGARAALKPGDRAPAFLLRAAEAGHERDVSLAALLSRGPVVLYFFPAAFTPGCSAEAHQFAAAVPRFQALGASVLGMSEDPIAKLDQFSVSECENKFAVASDPDGRTARAYDATLPLLSGYASRTSYLVAPDGTVLAAYTAMNPDGHVDRMLQALVGWVFEVLQPKLVHKVHGTVVHSAVIDQHRELLRAIERGDGARAERAMKDHLLYLRDVLRMVEERG